MANFNDVFLLEHCFLGFFIQMKAKNDINKFDLLFCSQQPPSQICLQYLYMPGSLHQSERSYRRFSWLMILVRCFSPDIVIYHTSAWDSKGLVKWISRKHKNGTENTQRKPFVLGKPVSLTDNIKIVNLFSRKSYSAEKTWGGPLVSNTFWDTVKTMKNSKGVPFGLCGPLEYPLQF